MKRGKRPVWLRWVMLAVTLGLCWAVWSEVEQYAVLKERAIFSTAEWERVLAAAQFSWVLRGLLAAVFLYQFAVWKLEKEDPAARFREGVFLSALALIWAGLRLFLPMEGSRMLSWLLLLLVLAAGAAMSWRKFSKIRPKHT